MIKVLVVDDSPVVREFLTQILESDPGIRVIATACNGEEAVRTVAEKSPDVVTMDVHMPGMDGYEATRIIMETKPVPIIAVSGNFDPGEVAMTFHALEAGAVAIVARPAAMGHPDHEKTAGELIRYVKAMSQVRPIRRWPKAVRGETAACTPDAASLGKAPRIRLVAIGASTGGPFTIQRILAALPRDFPLPLLVVQHMARGFIAGFAKWLSQSTGIPVKVAAHGEPPRPGHAYVAPDGFNMGVDREGRIELMEGTGGIGHCPSVSHLFRSVAEVYGKASVGILLTGMGKDGAAELLLMKERGAVTIAQDRASSVVYGMPGVAESLNAASFVLSPDSIAELLKGLFAGIGADKDGI
ncbi:MAG TPA: chemotaxis-specific protein-glutamate methyltransferase CheB [Geobacteraceae bacterium]